MSLALAEAEKLSLGGAWHISDWHLREASRVSLKRHGHRALDTVELNVGENVSICVTVKTYKVAPLFRGVNIVAHDLTGRHLGKAVEDFHWLRAGTQSNVEVVD